MSFISACLSFPTEKKQCYNVQTEETGTLPGFQPQEPGTKSSSSMITSGVKKVPARGGVVFSDGLETKLRSMIGHRPCSINNVCVV